jgi:hypothetical protein
MTKFKVDNDTGYIRVRDRLKLWVNSLADAVTPTSTNEGRHGENGTATPRSDIISGGGPVFMAPVHAGRDISTYGNIAVPPPPREARLLGWTDEENSASSRQEQMASARAT